MTFVHDVGVIADIECFFHVVVGDEYANISGGEISNFRLNVTYRNGIDAGKWSRP